MQRIRNNSNEPDDYAQAVSANADGEALFQGIFDAGLVGMGVADLNARYVRVNQTLCDLLGYTEAELVALPAGFTTHPDDRPLDELAAKSLLAGEIDRFERNKRYLHKDGHIVHAHLIVRLVHDKDAAPSHYVTVVEDISGRKRADAELHEALARAERRQLEITALLGAANAVLSRAPFEKTARAIFDHACSITGATSGYVALLSDDGMENEVLFLEAGGLPCTVDPNLPMPIRGLREQSYRTHSAVYDNDFANSKWMAFMPHGHVNLRNVLFAPLVIEGKAVGLMGMANKPADFTDDDAYLAQSFGEIAAVALENSRAVEAREAALAETQLSNAELEQFAYVASHDLQEPLRMITSYLQLIEKRNADRFDDTDREYFGFAIDGAQRMKALIAELLKYSRVGTHGRELAAVDTGSVLDVVVRTLGPAILEAGATVTADPLPAVHADEQQLTQVFQNLISNGIKYQQPGASPAVHVAATTDGGEVHFTVTDNGIGIDPKHYDRVFTVFQRLHTQEAYAGTGMGLAICKKIVERHGGRIWLTPADDGGTIVHFTLRAV